MRAGSRFTTYLRRTALLLCTTLGAAQASPLFDGSSSNAWLLEKSSGQVVGSFTVVAGHRWTDQATALGPNAARIFYDGGAGFADYFNLDLVNQELLINQTGQSLPTINPALPAVTLAGVDLALSDADPNQPGIAIAPASGAYDTTVAVRMHAVPGRGNSVDKVEIHWTLDGGAEQIVTAPVGGEAFDHTFYLVRDGSYQVDFWAVQGGFKSQPAPQTAGYELAASEPLQRDTDGDGVPDLVEVDLGMNPLVDDYALDTDGDGWTDFEERMRGTDPNDPLSLPAYSLDDTDGDGCPDFLEQKLGTSTTDPASTPATCTAAAAGVTTADSDGDGFSDFDEIARGTNPADASDHPVSRRLHEVEYLLGGAIYQDAAATIKQTEMTGLTARDISWEPLYDQQSLPAVQAAAADAALTNGDLPPAMRLPAGDPILLRAVHAPGGVPDAWVVKTWVDSEPDPHPNQVTAWLDASGSPWTTTAQWQAGYLAYLQDPLSGLVRTRQVAMSPASGLGTALVEGIVAWYSALSDGAMVLLGHDAGPMPAEAVAALRQTLGEAGRDFNGLHADLVGLLQPGRELNGFAVAVAAFYASPGSISESTTTRAAAALVQGGGRDPLFSYLARLLAWWPLAAIDDLSAPERAALMDLTGDADGDGVLNGNELDRPVPEATLPNNADSDGDLFPDGIDPCPADADNLCLLQMHQDDDTDGDGIADAVDNCMHTFNTGQQDSNADGIGDACLYYANIRTPASDVTVWVGGMVDFSSLVTEAGAGKTLAYNWSFGGSIPPSSQPNPGPVGFNTPGVYPVVLQVTDTGTGIVAGIDWRLVHVIGNGPQVDAGGPYAAVEGQPVQLTASATPSVGSITGYSWTFGDGNPGSGNPVSHTYLQNGSYTATVQVSDATGVPALDSATVDVADTAPVVSFSADVVTGLAPLNVQFTDQSSAYDPIVSHSWDFDDGSPPDPSLNPLHSFAGPGSYNVTLTVTDSDGSIGTFSLPINVLTAADGDLAPYGSPDGVLNAADILVAQQLVLGTLGPPTAQDLAHGDVYPVGAPDGVIDMSDLVLIMQMVMQP